jgi:ubiquinone biosynthesis protein
MNLDALEEDIFDLIDEYLQLSIGDVDVTRFFTDLTRLVVKHGLQLPGDMLLVTKALIAVEGIGLNLHPNFNFMAIFEPFARKLLLRRLEPGHLFAQGKEVLSDYGMLARHFPQDLRDILKMMKTGRLNLGFRVWGLTPLRRTLDSVSYRLIFGMILASLLVSSSLVLQSNVPPLWNGISIIGLAGYGLAGVIALGFLISLVIQLFRR